MAQSPEDDKLAALLARVDQATTSGNLAQAAVALREASILEPDNDDLKKRWVDLQGREGSGSYVLKMLNDYLASGKNEDGRKALQMLQQKKQLSQPEAVASYALLVQAKSTLELRDQLLGMLLGQQAEARKLIAVTLCGNAADTLSTLFQVGEESFKALMGVPLDGALWTSETLQITAQQSCFRLCIAKLNEAGVEHPERAMKAIARQLATAPESITSLIDQDVFDTVLSALDTRSDSSLRTQAMLSTSKLLEVSKEAGEGFFAVFIARRVAKQTSDDLIVAFSAAAALFPLLPALVAKLFMTEGFVQQLVPNLEMSSSVSVPGKVESKTLEQAALELLSAACIDKTCRGAVDKCCSDWLRDLSSEREGVHRALATLVLAKISEQSVDEVTAKLSNIVIDGHGEGTQAIEGLAYTSLQPKIKEKIANDSTLLKALVTALKDHPTSSFGTLTIFSNMTTYRQIQSEEAKKLSQLKAYANSAKPGNDDPLDNDKHVTARCKKSLDHDIVPALVARCKQTASSTSIALVVRILLSVAKEQKHRAKMAQQGAVKLLMLLRDRTARTDKDKDTREGALINRTAAHALARLLISVNPAHVFSTGLPATSAVSALTPLLASTDDGEQQDLLATFEALLALTNLASMDDSTARELLIRSSFDKVEDLLFSPNTLVQRASVELVCNLMASPSCVAKFADGSKDAKRRMQILLALSDVEDLAARRAAGGALAMLTEWDAAVNAVLDAKDGKGVKAVLGMCEDDSDEMRHRGLVCVLNLVSAPEAVGDTAIGMVKKMDGADILRAALKGTRNPDVLRIGVEVLRKLV
ncbi:hypothetical protein LTR08_001850 [Meristemomyces frigidus]|nr:hypothetical protein LTR08_001850 [Meristemomyces frigidus]